MMEQVNSQLEQILNTNPTCRHCGDTPLHNTGTWRINSNKIEQYWEHRCADAHPQAGYFRMEFELIDPTINRITLGNCEVEPSDGPWPLDVGLYHCAVKIGEAYVQGPYQPPDGRGRCPRQIADACLIHEAPALLLAMKLVMAGVARIEGNEFCFDGIRYSIVGDDWSHVFDIIGWNRLRSALKHNKVR